MNLDQVLSAVRWIIATGGGYAIGRGWITTDQLTYIGGAAAALVPLIWSMLAHTDKAKVIAAANVPETKVVTANPDLQAVARDPNQPNVVSPVAARATGL